MLKIDRKEKTIRPGYSNLQLNFSMNKDITFVPEAHEKLKAGVDKIANVVKATLGPGGANVILQRGDTQAITKDGVSVAREVILKDPIENVGAQIVKQASERTVAAAGDGTTTAMVLAQAIYSEGLNEITKGAKLIDVKRGIDLAVTEAVKGLKNISKKVEDPSIIRQVAMISSNGDTEIANLVADAMIEVGLEGVVSVEDSKTSETTRQRVEGMQWDRGYMSSAFVNRPEKMQCYLEDPVVLVYDGNIGSLREIMGKDQYNIIDRWRSDKEVGSCPLLVVCNDASAEFINIIGMNVLKQAMRACVVQAPEFHTTRKEILYDIAAMTGATVISKENGLTWRDVKVEHLGRCEAVKVTGWTTTIIGGQGILKAQQRMEEIRKQIEENANEYAVSVLKSRLARLKNGVNIIYVGGASPLEISEKKDRIDDSLNATRAAMEEGIVPGGGVAYLKVINSISSMETSNEDMALGMLIVKGALRVPARTIIENVGGDNRIVDLIMSDDQVIDYGYNAQTRTMENLYASGIIDPTKVTRLALENAASVAGLLLTTKAIVSNEKPTQQ